MPRKPKKGYFVRGQFVAEGSELDEELKREQRGESPSKTELKAHSTELQALGEQLLELRADLVEPLDLPTRLLDALEELGRITDFEGRRRQSQYLGKLMRKLDEAQVAAIRAALHEQRKGSAEQTLRLHTAEHWRDRLIEDDAAAGAWAAQFAGTDLQRHALAQGIRLSEHARATDVQREGVGVARLVAEVREREHPGTRGHQGAVLELQ